MLFPIDICPREPGALAAGLFFRGLCWRREGCGLFVKTLFTYTVSMGLLDVLQVDSQWAVDFNSHLNK